MIGWFIGGLVIGLFSNLTITREPDVDVYQRGFNDGYRAGLSK